MLSCVKLKQKQERERERVTYTIREENRRGSEEQKGEETLLKVIRYFCYFSDLGERKNKREKKRFSFLGLAKGVWLVYFSCNYP